MYAAGRHDPATVAHLQSHLFFTSLFGALGARRSGKAIVLSVHGVRAARSPFVNFLQEVWLRTTSRWLFRRSQRVVCLTDEDRVEVLRYGADPRRTVTLFNTYDDDAFFPAAGKGGSPGPVAPEALWVGRHVEEKGVRYLVQAWAKVHAALPEARLVLIGDGPLRAETEREVARQGLSDSVRFETFQPRAAVGEAMRSCQVFVLPSVREGFPLAVVEAMACGKPVVTTQGLATIVGAGGSVVPAKDADALAGALVDYLQNPARAARVGGQALQRARAEFGLERLTDAHLRIYAEALAEVRRHPRRPHGAGPADGGSPA
jgi:glycosyltransferase involved in cell wall biosynthesis